MGLTPVKFNSPLSAKFLTAVTANAVVKIQIGNPAGKINYLSRTIFKAYTTAITEHTINTRVRPAGIDHISKPG